MTEIEAVMSTDLVTVGPGDDLDTARAIMCDRDIRHLPVVKDKRLVGLLTMTDVLAATDSWLRNEDNSIPTSGLWVSDVMSTEIATVDQHASLRQAGRFLADHRIGCLPVVTNGRLVGIITERDFVRIAIDLLESREGEATDEPKYGI